MNVEKISVTGEKADGMKQVIYMIGMMGAGKTTVGRTLAQRIGWDFIDMDREIEREQGKRISEIFSSEGEPAFRAMETDLLKRLAGRRRTVIATGGGAALSPENQRLLAQSGLVIYLRVSPDDVLARTQGDATRPNLMADDKRARIESLLEIRSPIYCATADISFRSSGASSGSLVAKILKHPKLKKLIEDADKNL